MSETNAIMSEKALTRIREVVEASGLVSRRELSRRVCEALEWKSRGGRFALMSCRKRLVDLERRGMLQLPPPGKTIPPRKQAVEDTSVLGELVPLHGRLEELGPIELQLIPLGDKILSRVWNELMDRYHPLGGGSLCGAQLRYLFRSVKYGWLGGLGFSAAAWQLYARDTFIGWNDVARRIHLPEVLANSRFLIRPDIQTKNLASHILGQVVKRVGVDFSARYGYQPVLLETFVEHGKYEATCYRAASWKYVGQSAGRGRQDSGHEAPEAVKDIFVYPLREDWRSHLSRIPATIPKKGGDGSGSGDWAKNEFGNVELGDERLRNRLVNLAHAFFAAPRANIPEACGSTAATRAAYRFFDHEATDLQTLLAPHFEATVSRVAEHPIVLAVQDTTSLDYTSHPATSGLGPLNTSKDQSRGLHLHDTMAFDPQGTPLGLLNIQIWARKDGCFDKASKRYDLDIKDKESFKWLQSYEAASEVQRRCPDSMIVSVGDRESDIYELFESALKTPDGAKVLVRARIERVLTNDQPLWTFVKSLPEAGIQKTHVPRKGEADARTAKLSIRYSQITLRPPKRKRSKKPLTLWAVYAVELDPPDSIEQPLEWLLLTTVETSTFEEAVVRLSWYMRRWGIEVFHRTLKSGCKVEKRQLETSERILSCLAIDLVVAWRIQHLTFLGREVPNLPCTVFFEEAEWKVLMVEKTGKAFPNCAPPTLGEAIALLAQLGGHLGRKSDGPPGTETIWRGMTLLQPMARLYQTVAGQVPPEIKLRC